MKELNSEEKIKVCFDSLEKQNNELRQGLVTDLVEFKLYANSEITDERFNKLARYHNTFYKFLEKAKEKYLNIKDIEELRALDLCSHLYLMNKKIEEYQSQVLLEESFHQLDYLIEIPAINGLLPEEVIDIIDVIHNFERQDNQETTKKQEQELDKQIKKIRKENYFE